MKDVAITIQSQYAASPTLTQLIQSCNTLIDPKADIQLFYDTIFNIQTAQGVGLDIWGRIVGVSRGVDVVQLSEFFGYEGSSLEPWDQGIFYDGQQQGQTENAGVYNLTDTAFRKLILWKALANISTCDLATFNKLLGKLFPQRVIFTQEIDVMQIRIMSIPALEPWERAILRMYGLFAKAAGVSYEWLEIEDVYLGFATDYQLAPFGQGTFYDGQPLS